MIINAVAQHSLQLFVIDPAGADLAKRVSPTYGAIILEGATPLEEAFAKGLIDASRRSLREIFGGDSVEYHSVKRFFAM